MVEARYALCVPVGFCCADSALFMQQFKESL
jgi:hypothetical protein